MKNSILHLIFLLAIILYSCGSDDNPTGGNNNQPSNVLFQSALLELNIPSGSGIQQDTVSYIFADTTIQTIKVDFNVNTNIDTLVSANWTVFVSIRDSIFSAWSAYNYFTPRLDTNVSVIVDIAHMPNLFAKFRLQSTGNNSGSSVFIRFRNIKITKLS